MVGVIVPRPIAFVSTVSPEGIYNLAPFSFFTGASINPPVVCFCPLRNADGHPKDTLRNVERTGDFAPALARAMASGKPAILHCPMDPQAITPNTTLDEIRSNRSKIDVTE